MKVTKYEPGVLVTRPKYRHRDHCMKLMYQKSGNVTLSAQIAQIAQIWFLNLKQGQGKTNNALVSHKTK
jgi:hypothetical protein